MSKQNRLPEGDIRLLRLLERYAKLEAVDKLTVGVTFLIVALVVFALGTSAVFFLCSGLVHTLSELVGSDALANYIIGGVLLLLIIVFYVFRVTLVENRVIAAVSASILRSEIISGAKRENDGEDEEDDEEGGER